LVARRIFSQSASIMQSDDTDLTLKFDNAFLKNDKIFPLESFGVYQGTGQAASVV
jgi:uncharacterized protein YjfI (DUF2170 family)